MNDQTVDIYIVSAKDKYFSFIAKDIVGKASDGFKDVFVTMYDSKGSPFDINDHSDVQSMFDEMTKDNFPHRGKAGLFFCSDPFATINLYETIHNDGYRIIPVFIEPYSTQIMKIIRSNWDSMSYIDIKDVFDSILESNKNVRFDNDDFINVTYDPVFFDIESTIDEILTRSLLVIPSYKSIDSETEF